MTHMRMVDKLNTAMNRIATVIDELPDATLASMLRGNSQSFSHKSELRRALEELGEVKAGIIEVAYRPNPPKALSGLGRAMVTYQRESRKC